MSLQKAALDVLGPPAYWPCVHKGCPIAGPCKFLASGYVPPEHLWNEDQLRELDKVKSAAEENRRKKLKADEEAAAARPDRRPEMSFYILSEISPQTPGPPHSAHIGFAINWEEFFKLSMVAAARVEYDLPGSQQWARTMIVDISGGTLPESISPPDHQLALVVCCDDIADGTMDALYVLAIMALPWAGRVRLYIGAPAPIDVIISTNFEAMVRAKVVDVVRLGVHVGPTSHEPPVVHYSSAYNSVIEHARTDGATLACVLKGGQILGFDGIAFIMNAGEPPDGTVWGIQPDTRQTGVLALHLVNPSDDGTTDTLIFPTWFFAAVGGFDLAFKYPYSHDFAERVGMVGKYRWVSDAQRAGVDVGKRWQDKAPDLKDALEVMRTTSEYKTSRGLVVRNQRRDPDPAQSSSSDTGAMPSKDWAPLKLSQHNFSQLNEEDVQYRDAKIQKWGDEESLREADFLEDDDISCAMMFLATGALSFVRDANEWRNVPAYTTGAIRNVDPKPFNPAAPIVALKPRSHGET